jgi:hypothetical protein
VVAGARPGGVVVSGDRGLLVCLLLALGGAPCDVIADRWAARDPAAVDLLATVHASPRDVVRETLAAVDVRALVGPAVADAVRARLGAPPG